MSADYFFETTIGEQMTLQRGFDITRKQQQPGQVPVVSSGGISSFHNEPKVTGPGVVLGRKGTLGTAFYIKEDFWPHDTTLWVKDFKGNNPAFVYYFFRNMGDALKKMDVGAANPALNRNHLHPLEIWWPTRSLQDYIAEVLTNLDDKIANNHQISQTLEKMSQALFKSWFVDFDPVKAKVAALEAGGTAGDAERAAMQAISDKSDSELDTLKTQNPDQYDNFARIATLFPSAMVESELGKIPAGWEFRPVSDFASLKGGKQLKKEYISSAGTFPVFGGAGVMGYTEFNNANGDIISIGRVGAYCGQVFYYQGAAWINNNATYVNPMSFSIFYWLFKSISNANFESIKKGAAQPFISNGDMASLRLAWGGDLLTKEFEKIVRPLFGMASNKIIESNSLAEMRDAMLPKLLSGELNPLGQEERTSESADV